MTGEQDPVKESIARSLALASQRRDALFGKWINLPEKRSPATSQSAVHRVEPLLSTTPTIGSPGHLLKGDDVFSKEDKLSISTQSAVEAGSESTYIQKKMCAIFQSASQMSTQILTSQAPDPMKLEPKLAPYVIALMLESAGAEWEKAHAWTKYLVAEMKQAAFIEQTVQDMTVRKQALSAEYSSARLIIANIAAGATARDVYAVFARFETKMLKVAMFPNRTPVARTQRAYVEFSSRTHALKAAASQQHMQIFGLQLHKQVAVKEVVNELVHIPGF